MDLFQIGIMKRYMIGTMACMFILACSSQRNIGRDGYRLLSMNEGNVIDSLIIDSIYSLYDESYSDFIICSMGIESPEAYNILDDSSYISSIVFVKCDSIYEYWCVARPKEAFTADDVTSVYNYLPFVAGQGRIDGRKIFAYKYIWQCGVIQSEGNLNFVPPLCLASLVIYKKHGHQQFYLENMGYLDNSDSPYSYVAQADREKYRKRWLKRINKLIYEVRYMVEKDKSLNEKNDKK